MNYILRIILILVAFPPYGWSLNLSQSLQAEPCETTVLGTEHGLRQFEDIKHLRIMVWNMENLKASVGKFAHTSAHGLKPSRPLPGRGNGNPNEKPEYKKRWGGQIILKHRPDIIIAPEVENLEAAQEYAKTYLKDLYTSLLIKGNDKRGIDINFWIKKDILVNVEQMSHRNQTWLDPIDGDIVPLFSRDLPLLIFRSAATKKVLMIVMGTHNKSKRDRPGDKESKALRGAQLEYSAQLESQLRDRYGEEIPILFGGDFNTDVISSEEIQPVRAAFDDAFDLAHPQGVSLTDRITHSYHTFDGQNHYTPMDALFVSLGLNYRVTNAQVIRYRNQQGQILPLARSWDERNQQPSDHLPSIYDLVQGP